MAKEIIVDIKINGTDEAVSNVQKLEQEIEKLNKQKEELLKSPSVSSGDFSKKLDEIDSQLGKLEKTYESATGKAAKFEKAQKNLEGVAKTLSGSINLVSGTLATFGVKNEEVEKALLRVQAASSFASGLKDLQEGFKALGGTFGGLTKIMMANPFVLIATLVASLIGYFGGFEAILGVVKNAATALFDSLGSLIGINKEYKDELISATAAIERYEAALSALDNRYSAEERTLTNRIALLKAQGAPLDDILKAENKLIETRRNNAATLIAENKAVLVGLQAKLKVTTDIKEQEVLNAEIIKAGTALNTARANFDQAKADVDIKNAQDKTDALLKQKDAAATASEEEKNRIKNLLNTTIEAEKAKVVVTKEGSTERLEAELQSITTIEMFQKKYATELGITQNGITILLQENIDKRKKLEDEYYAYVNKLSNNTLETKKLTVTKEIDLKKLGADAIAQIDNKTSETDAERRAREAIEQKKAINSAIKYTEMGADALGQIGNLVFENKKSKLEKGSKEEEKVAKKQFQFNKALQLGLAVMDGYKAITASLAQSPIAIGPVPNPAGIASLAFAALTSGINIAKIAATKFEGSASANSSSAPSAPTPSLGASGSIAPTTFQPTAFGTGANQQQTFGGQGGNGGGNVLRAYVSETDLTTTSRRLGGIRNASEL